MGLPVMTGGDVGRVLVGNDRGFLWWWRSTVIRFDGGEFGSECCGFEWFLWCLCGCSRRETGWLGIGRQWMVSLMAVLASGKSSWMVVDCLVEPCVWVGDLRLFRQWLRAMTVGVWSPNYSKYDGGSNWLNGGSGWL